MLHHIVGEVAWGIAATAILHGVAHEVEVLLQVDIEGWHGPVALGFLGFLLHAQHAHVVVELHDTRALQLLYRGLFVAHDARGLLLAGKIDELLEGEEEQVVGSYHEQIIVQAQLLHGVEQVADGTQTRFVGLSTIIDDGNGFGVVLFLLPVFEDGGELMIGDDDMLIDLRDAVYVVEHPSEDGALSYFQQWFREVLCQFPQPRGVSCCYHNTFHL